MVGRWMVSRCPAAAMLTVALAASSATAAPDDPLAAYRWRSRVLVVCAPTADDARLARQRTVLEAAGAGIHERDLVVVEGIGSGVQADALRRRLDVPAEQFQAVLIGKDGGAKLVSDEPIPTDKLFRVIDAMPMRRDEIRRR